jgi:hypothetical protein
MLTGVVARSTAFAEEGDTSWSDVRRPADLLRAERRYAADQLEIYETIQSMELCFDG